MTNTVTFHCHICNCPLEQCDDLNHECDEMWIAPAYDGKGGKGYIVQIVLTSEMTKHRQQSNENESRTKLGFYFSRTGSVETEEAPNLKMYCPRCKGWRPQVKGFLFRGKDDVPCIRCKSCNLVHDSLFYKKLIAELKATGWKPPF